MNKSDIDLLIDYNYWANARILNAAGPLTLEQYTAPAGLSHGSIRGMLVHTLSAESIWLARWQGVSPTAMLAEGDFPDLAALKARWAAEERAMRAYIAGLSDADLQQTVHYKDRKGNPFQNPLWQLAAHLVNHGTQSRSEVAVALTSFNCSPGDIDLILFLRQKAG